MTDGWLIGAVAAVIVSGALAIAGIERGVPLLTRIFKPLATILLLAIVGWPHSILRMAGRGRHPAVAGG